MIDPDKILFFPSTRRGNGTGHLKRCIDWGEELGVIHIYATDKGVGTDPRFSERSDIIWHDSPEGDWELIVLDNRETGNIPEELKSVPLAAIDESGSIRSAASYTIDIIPGGRPGLPPNLQALSFMSSPGLKHESGEINKILVCFGGEDPSGISERLLEGLIEDSQWSALFHWHFLSPELKPSSVTPGSISIEKPLSDLKSVIPEFDLVICSFGLMAFEALAAEVPVILLNPTPYHDRLSRNAGLSYHPKAWKSHGAQLAARIRAFLNDPEWQNRICPNQFERYPSREGSLPRWLKEMQLSRDACPACGSKERSGIARFENKSYFRCSDCSMLYMVQFRKKKEIYTEDYFFSEYKAQYGKTYIEDFEAIAAMSRKRLAFMASLGKRKGRLLDIGCAYGPFLREARDSGFEAYGLEISPEAVDYVNTNLSGIKAKVGNIEDDSSESLYDIPFDAITFWYVIEHMQKLDEVLPRVAAMLNPEGLLCLSTPCGNGISGLKNRKEFLRHSPEDHYSVWTRASALRILKRHGFHHIRFRSTGHHPERFPRLLCLVLPFSIRAVISRLFGLGDSIEIYAKRDLS